MIPLEIPSSTYFKPGLVDVTSTGYCLKLSGVKFGNHVPSSCAYTIATAVLYPRAEELGVNDIGLTSEISDEVARRGGGGGQ